MKGDKIERNLLEKAAHDFEETHRRINEESLLTSQSARQAHFEANYKKK
jgi:hypothetical protein